MYISRVASPFYKTEFEIWADFGPVGSTAIKLKYANFEDSFLWTKEIIIKN